MPCRLLRVLLACVIVSVVCSAQLDTASVVGTVLDQTGAVIPNASIVVENQHTGSTRNTNANGEGNFVVPALPIGQYRITASAAGFKSRAVEGFTLRVSDRLRVEITLEPELFPLLAQEKE